MSPSANASFQQKPDTNGVEADALISAHVGADALVCPAEHRSATFFAALAVTLVATCFSTACSKEKEQEPIVTVQAATAEKTTLQQTISAQAVLFPLQQAAITPKISAPVHKFYVNRGSKVHKDQLLAQLENRDLTASSEENKGSLEQARAAYETTTAASLPEELQKAQLDMEAAKKTLDAQQKVYDS